MGDYTEDTVELLRKARQDVAVLEAELAREQQARALAIQSAAQPAIIETTAEPAPVLVDPAELCLDLGSGPRPAPGFKGVDIVEGITDFCMRLDSGRSWPWSHGSVSKFRACHFIEHIRAEYVQAPSRTDFNDTEEQDAFFFFFDEAWRCAKPGATFELQWPALKNHRAFQDPTHRRFIPQETLLYLDAKWRELQSLAHYNVRCDWVLEATSPTIPEVIAKQHQGAIGEELLRQKLSREWNLEQDYTATLRARK